MIDIAVRDLKKEYEVGQPVLDGLTFQVDTGERVGILGRNGAGKTTLFRILTGQEEADSGEVILSPGKRLGLISQIPVYPAGYTVEDVLRTAFDDLKAMEAELHQISDQLGSGDKDLLARYDRLQAAYEAGGGYEIETRLEKICAGLGIERAFRDKNFADLSGGEKTRINLARLILVDTEILLLDEPTNHLDLKSIAWLEEYLLGYGGAVLLISHDRYFMDHVCDHMAELLLGTIETYDGNYTRYMQQRTQRFEIRMKAYEMQQKEIARQEAIIARYRAFNREKSIRAAESREKRLEKMERLEKPVEEGAIHFRFDIRRRTGEDVLMGEELQKGYGDRVLFSHVKLHLRAGDRVALIGDNGVGKSTLLKCIIGQEHFDQGEIRLGTGVDIGYYDQHQAQLHENKTVLDEVWDDFHRMEQSEVRGALGMFLFTGDEVFAPISTLSGGEKGRVALTKLMLRKDNLLLLDEPTNHLDMDSREVLEAALEDYPGTILAISHDRYFINRFADRVMVMNSDGVTEYLGNFDDYVEKRDRPQPPAARPPTGISRRPPKPPRTRRSAAPGRPPSA